VADHILSVTYPLVQDSKLLLAVVENICFAFDNAMTSVLAYERLFKRIPEVGEKFEIKFDIFRNKIAPKYSIKDEYLKAIVELREMIKEHKESPIEFSRKDKFIICSDSYKMRTLSKEEIKKYISKAKLFIEEVNHITSKNEGIFR
jgi:hypothetical protein